MNYKKDLIITAVGSIIFLGFVLYIDAFDSFYKWTRSYEEYEADEVILLMFYYMVALAVISFRSWKDSERSNHKLKQEMSRRLSLQKELRYQSSHDKLTGLLNRHEFESQMTQILQHIETDNTKHVLCYLDLDQFKRINDTVGHCAGDQLLYHVAYLLKNTVRSKDTVARLGGDEFGILIEDCEIGHACRVADSILEVIHDFQFKFESDELRTTVSIGLVAIDNSKSNLTELLKKADLACHIAKDNGRNCLHVYEENDIHIAQRHGEMQWANRLNSAFQEERFCIYAQSIMPLTDDGRPHYELLIRMKDNEGNIILPGTFIPAAERYNMIEKLDGWVVDTAFRLLASYPVFLEEVECISINLSGQLFTNNKFLDFIKNKLDEYSIQPSKICFEITETAAIYNINSAIKFICTLKEHGCLFALDDFGSGLSSYGYLKNLPADYLKIDGLFIKNIVNDPIDFAMVKSINEVGHLMGMRTIAEFVESDEIKDKLKTINVNFVQGYAISKPIDFEELLKFELLSNAVEFSTPA